MNKKCVAVALSRRHQKFIDSITDQEVKDILDKHSIISGGAIASLLLNERVNDLDYYLDSEDNAEKVAKYFVDKYYELHPNKTKDISVLREIDYYDYTEDKIKSNKRLRIFIQSKGIEGNIEDVISDQDTNDINPENLEDSIEVVDLPSYRPIFFTSNAITLSNRVQIIIRFSGNSEEIHKNFDYIHCTNYWRSENRQCYINQAAIESLLSKQLFYKGSKYPLCSIFRTRKFLKRGWHINAGQYVKMAMELNELNLLDPWVLEDQLIGVDNAFFSQIIYDLRRRIETDKEFKLTSGYIISIIDKIF